LPADRGGRPGFLHLDIKKASCVEVKLDRAGAGELISMLTPKMLRRLAR
jgi:hypothetical protein